jgi:hypothetical protein
MRASRTSTCSGTRPADTSGREGTVRRLFLRLISAAAQGLINAAAGDRAHRIQDVPKV